MGQENEQEDLLEKLLEDSSKKSSFDFWQVFQKNPISVVIAIFGCVLIVFGSVILWRNFSSDNKVQIIELEDGVGGDVKIVVHVSGAVEKPGVYELSNGARLNELLSLAGGLSDKADRDWFNKNINLAQKVSDGSKIYIPYQGELGISGESGIVKGVSSWQGRVNINTASQSELESLPKIGPVIALRIIEYREKNGSFAKVEDLSRVPGLNSKTIEAIKNLVSIF